MNRSRTTPILLVAALAAGLLFAPGAEASAFKLIAPAADSFVAQEEVLLIVKIEDPSPELKQVELLDNGKSAGFLKVRGGVVATILKVGEGAHELAFAAPGMKRLGIKVFRGKQAGYRFHAEMSLAACARCHPFADSGGWGLPTGNEASEGKLCAECHDLAEKGKFVHGPVAANICSPCHDPHGSNNPNFLVATGRDLCLACHNQGLSANHISERKNADCTSCHDPHSSAKQFHLRVKN